MYTGSLGLGDVNDDGFIDSLDASEILRAYAVMSVEKNKDLSRVYSYCDVNKDNYVDSVDASVVLAYYAYLSVNSGNKKVKFTTFMMNR